MSAPLPPVKLPRKAWIVFGVVLALTVLVDPFAHHHPYFGFDGWFGFHAFFGFLACLAMVLLSKLLLGKILSRPDDHYDD